jgi:hypothetical protein
MKAEEILVELNKLLKPENETVEDVYYNAAIIDAIKAVQKVESRQTAKQK